MKPTSFVLDCSVTMTWCFEDEARQDCDELQDWLASGVTGWVPALWPAEVANCIVMGERKSRIQPLVRSKFISMLNNFNIVTDDETRSRAFMDSMALAREHNLTVYDAIYLELAMRRSLPLATLDEALRKAAIIAGVLLLPEKL